MFDELPTYWQNLNTETQTAVQVAGGVVAVLLLGHFLGAIVARRLRAINFDAAFRLPGSSPPAPADKHGITPTFIAGMLVRLTLWAGAAWWLARQHGRPDIAATLGMILRGTWTVTALLATVLGLGSLLASRVIDCLSGPKADSEAYPLRHGTATTHRNYAGVVGAGAYCLVTLLVLLIAADFFEWPLARTAGVALWQLTQNLLLAGGALLIGYVGASAARQFAGTGGAASLEQRVGQYTAVAVVAATTLLAVSVLVSRGAVLLGVAAILIVGFSLWLGRGYLPDFNAGLLLRTRKVREVWFDGAPWQVADVGWMSSQVVRAGAVHRLQNRRVLEASSAEAHSEASGNGRAVSANGHA